MMNNYPDYLFEEELKREDENRPFYRFFAANYFATGEGVSYWLKICRNYEPYGDVDHDMERFKEFIDCSPCPCAVGKLGVCPLYPSRINNSHTDAYEA